MVSILILLTIFAGMGAILYTPALPLIADTFDISDGAAQFTVTVYLVGYALGQLPYGPLANFIGRKKSILVGAIIALIGSLLCAVAPSYWIFIAGRFISALGMSVGLVLTFTIIGDVYEETRARRVVAIILIPSMVVPGLSVAAGGVLTAAFGWRSCFYFLAIYSVFMAYVSFRLPHTGGVGRGITHPFSQLRNPIVMLGGTILGLSSGIIYVFAAKAPFIGIDLIGLTPQTYGLFNIIPLVGLVAGAILAVALAHRASLQTSFWAAITIMSPFALLMLTLFAMGLVNTATLFLPITLLFIGMAPQYTPISAYITSNGFDKSNASAMMSFLNLSVATLSVFLANLIAPKQPLAMPIFFLCQLALMSILFKRLAQTHG
jgi:MFS transporter, DHA1 family, multidrug resistance protein